MYSKKEIYSDSSFYIDDEFISIGEWIENDRFTALLNDSVWFVGVLVFNKNGEDYIECDSYNRFDENYCYFSGMDTAYVASKEET